ncbi:hypothetical protein V3H18_12150 [Methylocystis sp. 9N]|uniref:Uncharacterized protein n=1 Tax=Methylocystis borbori TaxID=3118750 RepID=A0ABU7XLC1_9HYPH
MRHPDEHRLGADSRVGLPPGVWSLAAFSIAVCLFSVLGAKLLSAMFDGNDAPPLAFLGQDSEVEMRRLAGSAPQAQAPQAAKILRGGARIDAATTATIAQKPTVGQALAPCGDAPK